jgi:hypothetical protein
MEPPIEVILDPIQLLTHLHCSSASVAHQTLGNKKAAGSSIPDG